MKLPEHPPDRWQGPSVHLQRLTFSLHRVDPLWFVSCDTCTYCKLLWTKASANVNVLQVCKKVESKPGSDFMFHVIDVLVKGFYRGHSDGDKERYPIRKYCQFPPCFSDYNVLKSDCE